MTVLSTLFMLHRLEGPDVVVLLLVEVAELIQVVGQALYCIDDRVAGLEADDLIGLLDADLVVSEVLDMFDVDLGMDVEVVLHALLDRVADLPDRKIAGGDIEDA